MSNFDMKSWLAEKTWIGKVALVRLRGHFSYASARELIARTGWVTKGHELVIFDFTDAARVDTSATLAVAELIESAKSDNTDCMIAGLSGVAEETLQSLGVLDALAPGRVAATRHEAIVTATDLVRS